MKSTLIKHSRGIAAVESLIVLPVLLLIFAVIVEFGNAFIRYNTLSKAVQIAARYSVTNVYGTAESDAIADEEQIKNMVVFGNKAGTGSPVLDTLTVDDVTVNSGVSKYVIVTATYTYSPLFNFKPLASALADLQFSSSAVMRTGI